MENTLKAHSHTKRMCAKNVVLGYWHGFQLMFMRDNLRENVMPDFKLLTKFKRVFHAFRVLCGNGP